MAMRAAILDSTACLRSFRRDGITAVRTYADLLELMSVPQRLVRQTHSCVQTKCTKLCISLGINITSFFNNVQAFSPQDILAEK